MKTFIIGVKIILLFIFVLLSFVGISLLNAEIYDGGIIIILISIIPCVFITRSLFRKNNMKEKKKCPLCGEIIVWTNMPPIGSKELKSGGKLCFKCSLKIKQLNSALMSNIGEYSIDDIVCLFNTPPQTTNNIIRLHKYVEGFDVKQIKGKTIQLLESLFIMETSHNPDTVIGRGDFVRNTLNNMITFREDLNFLNAIQFGIDKYNVMYYDRTIPEHHIAILINPEITISSFNTFCKNCLMSSCLAYFDKQIEQLDNLKQQKAKNNRINKMENVMKSVLVELDKIQLCDLNNILETKFETIKNIYYKD